MTEPEWLVCDDTYKMLAFLGNRAGERKGRLFMTGCCRRSWHLIHDERCRNAVEVAERFADGQASDQELLQAFLELSRIEAARLPVPNAEELATRQSWSEPEDLVVGACRRAVRRPGRIPGTLCATSANHLVLAVARSSEAAGMAEAQAQSDLLRHIFGNPFHPYSAPAAWPSAIVRLATSLNEGQDCGFALHDALLEAGHPQLAEHFREEPWHPRGCRALDLLMGKSSAE